VTRRCPHDDRAGRFFHRWQAWAQGIAYAFVIARRVRVRAELVLEIECRDEDGYECRYLEQRSLAGM